MRLGIVRRSLMVRLVLFFAAVAFFASLGTGYLSLTSVRGPMEALILEHLKDSAALGRDRLHDYFREVADGLRFIAGTARIVTAAEVLARIRAGATGSSSPGQAGTEAALKAVGFDASERTTVLTGLDGFAQRYFEVNRPEEGFQDLLLVGTDGIVLYSYRKLSDLGTDLKTGALKGSGLAKVWEKVARTSATRIQDLETYQPCGGPALFVATPIQGDNRELRGVLAIRLGPEKINAIMKQVSDIGTSGDAYLVGQDLLLRSVSRQVGDQTLVKKVDTTAIREVLAGKEGVGEIIGMRGIPVLNAWTPLSLDKRKTYQADFDWAMIAKLDSDEAFAPIRRVQLKVGLIVLVVAIAASVVAFFLSKAISSPVSTMAKVAAAVSKGELSVEVPLLDRSDEIGELSHAFRAMVQALKDQIGSILEGVNILSASAAEISATVRQLAASATETSAAVTETSTTVEQVRQAAKVASNKASAVAENAREAVSTAGAGSTATSDTVGKIHLIKDQMESIGETVVRLSEHSRAIEEIIATVQDLADQSNLLAVNASIEAARAGDHGKGFAVVAHEIKSLADQSKQATQQVRTILEDTRRWVSAVVMATEQGSKAVQAGVEQSAIAGQAIGKLSQSVQSSAQSASVIQASSEQQVVGVDQVSNAMVSIEQAVQQNVSGITQLEKAADKLAELGTQLKEMVRHYRI